MKKFCKIKIIIFETESNFYINLLLFADLNECATEQHNCITGSQRCDNTVGSFLCIRITPCGTGYILHHTTSECEGRYHSNAFTFITDTVNITTRDKTSHGVLQATFTLSGLYSRTYLFHQLMSVFSSLSLNGSFMGKFLVIAGCAKLKIDAYLLRVFMVICFQKWTNIVFFHQRSYLHTVHACLRLG